MSRDQPRRPGDRETFDFVKPQAERVTGTEAACDGTSFDAELNIAGLNIDLVGDKGASVGSHPETGSRPLTSQPDWWRILKHGG